MLASYDTVMQTLRQLKPELARKYHVSSIGVFGSIVRDDFEPGKSDIDVIVSFAKPVGIEFIELADFLESKLNYRVDLVSANGVKPSYLSHISSEIRYV